MGHQGLRRPTTHLAIVGCVLALLATGCATDEHSSQMGSAADGLIDCLVPGQIRQLDEKVTYPTQRQLVRATREECHARGGEEK